MLRFTSIDKSKCSFYVNIKKWFYSLKTQITLTVIKIIEKKFLKLAKTKSKKLYSML